MGRSRFRIHDDLYPHFITCSIVAWLPILSRPEAAQIVLDSWRFQHESQRICLQGYVVMENHVYYIATGQDLAKRIGEFKSFTARRIIDFLQQRGDRNLLTSLEKLKQAHRVDSQYQLWQEGSHPIQIDTDEMIEQKLDYIHNNPVKRGCVDSPEHWRRSSMRNYLGQEGLIPVETNWR